MKTLMARAQVGMTDLFRRLATIDIAAPNGCLLQSAFYDEALSRDHCEAFGQWLTLYTARLRQEGRTKQGRTEQTNAVNPRFVPCNYLAQQAIERADTGMIHEFFDTMRRP